MSDLNEQNEETNEVSNVALSEEHNEEGTKLDKFKHQFIKIGLIIVIVITVIFGIVLLYAKSQLQQTVNTANQLVQNIEQWKELHKQANISPIALGYAVARTEVEFETIKKRFGMQSSQLNYIEVDNIWKLRIVSGNGQNVLSMIERLEQIGLTVTEFNLTPDEDNNKKMSGDAKLIMLWDWYDVAQPTTAAEG